MANEDKATRYQRLRRRATVASVASSAAALLLLHVIGGPPAWVSTGEPSSLTPTLLALAAAAFNVLAAAMAASFPATFFRDVVLSRRYGLMREVPAAWVKEWARHAAMGVAIGTLAVVGCTVSRLLVPRWWWAIDGVVAAIAPYAAGRALQAAGKAPMGGTVLRKGELRDRLTRLLEKAGLAGLGLYETQVGDRTRLTNAAVISVGGARRVILPDTLLADHTDEEVEVVVAHELAHVVHRDVVASQCAFGLHMAVSLLGADALLRWAGLPAAMLPPSALAGALLATGSTFVALRPLSLALSRLQERLADRYALTITGNAPALASVVRRMAANNLVEPVPSRASVWWFHSHPAVSERMSLSGAAEGGKAGNQ